MMLPREMKKFQHPSAPSMELAQSQICGCSPRLGPRSRLCSSLLHNCPGGTTGLAGPPQRPLCSGMVPHGSGRRWVAPQCLGPSHLYPVAGAAGESTDQFLPHPAPEDSDLAEQILKDPYNFDFLTLASSAKERELERGLLTHHRDLQRVSTTTLRARPGHGLAHWQHWSSTF